MSLREGIYREVEVERGRQDALHPYYVSDEVMLTVLVEEVGEVAKAMLEGLPESTREEILQCAAVCVKWLELHSETSRLRKGA